VNLTAALANTAWLAASAPAHLRFQRCLDYPAEAQWRVLRANLERNAATAYGRAHDFAAIRNYEDFARRVPLIDYHAMEPWIARIQRGDQAVLTQERVTRLLPTSGSSGGRKLIPFTAGLQRDFNAAIGPWLYDLVRQHPTIVFGPAYWSITPNIPPRKNESSIVPVGFDEDSRYLGGARSWLLNAVMAVPSTVRHVTNITEFRRTVLRHLLLRPDLRMISVWHPSFLTLLFDALECEWEGLLASLPSRDRRTLRNADPAQPETIWPALRLVSCWADAHAAGPAAELRRCLPNVTIQSKGLLATEAFISLPFRGAQPLAICSHFFEFINETNRVVPIEALATGANYEVVVTTSGGLWRYRLGDRVEVTGMVGRTPTIRFLGRVGNISDRCGEKLSETFVANILASHCGTARFAMLAPERDAYGWHYTLFLENGDDATPRAASIDVALRENPHYALCRDLGQLSELRICVVAGGAYEKFVAAETAQGIRLGDIKPAALSQRTDWARWFRDDFAHQHSDHDISP
jgi:hypothetical protein